MPKAAAKLIVDFIEEIPDSKLSGLPSKSGTIYDDTNFRLDMQGLTTPRNDGRDYNLQVQVNAQTRHNRLRLYVGKTVAHVLVDMKSDMTPADIRRELICNCHITIDRLLGNSSSIPTQPKQPGLRNCQATESPSRAPRNPDTGTDKATEISVSPRKPSGARTGKAKGNHKESKNQAKHRVAKKHEAQGRMTSRNHSAR